MGVLRLGWLEVVGEGNGGFWRAALEGCSAEIKKARRLGKAIAIKSKCQMIG